MRKSNYFTITAGSREPDPVKRINSRLISYVNFCYDKEVEVAILDLRGEFENEVGEALSIPVLTTPFNQERMIRYIVLWDGKDTYIKSAIDMVETFLNLTVVNYNELKF